MEAANQLRLSQSIPNPSIYFLHLPRSFSLAQKDRLLHLAGICILPTPDLGSCASLSQPEISWQQNTMNGRMTRLNELNWISLLTVAKEAVGYH